MVAATASSFLFVVVVVMAAARAGAFQPQQQQQQCRGRSRTTPDRFSVVVSRRTAPFSFLSASSSSSSASDATVTASDKQQQQLNGDASVSDGDTTNNKNKKKKRCQHALAVLAMPYTSVDRIANEAILETVLPTTDKLSVVLKCEGSRTPSIASLRRYVGEVYSQLWDCAMDTQSPDLPDVVVYPAYLPNAAPEGWITIQRDLDCICSHDSFIGWTSEAATGSRGTAYASKEGRGGLDEHVAALNSERKSRNLRPVQALHVERWPAALADAGQNVLFLDDDEGEECLIRAVRNDEDEDDDEGEISASTNGNLLMGGSPTVPAKQLFEKVAVGGTFDGMHFGHRKLLTLAVSSVQPYSNGKLLVGVTCDEMLQKKSFAEYIPPLQERMKAVERFLARLAPGMMNRIKIVPIVDPFGPPGHDADFDALVLSHETLETGQRLNEHRVAQGMKPLALLCTRRTEAHGMCSTTLRRLRSQRQKQQQDNEKEQ